MQLVQDVRQAGRFLRRRPFFAATSILTLALGVGAATALYSVIRGVLLAPLPYEEPDRLTTVWSRFDRQGVARAPLSGPELVDLGERSDLFEGFAGIWPRFATLGGTDDPEQINIGIVTGNFFDVLGAKPLHGRMIRPEDDVSGAPDAVVLSYEVFARRYGADTSLVGGSILYNGEPWTLLGVMAPGFEVLMPPDARIPETSAWIPWRRNYAEMDRNWRIFRGLGRLKPGVEPSAGRAELAAVATGLAASEAAYVESGLAFDVEPLQEDVVAHVRPALLALFGAVGVLLLIASTNVASLLLVQAAGREQEMALRTALGASRGRSIRQLVIENLGLFVAGGCFGAVLAAAALAALPVLVPAELPRLEAVRLDGTALLFGLGTVLLTGLLFGSLPAWHATRGNLVTALKEGRGTPRPGRHHLRSFLVIVEVALAVLLLVGAGLMLHSFRALGQVERGFVAEEVLTLKISLPSSRYSYRKPELISAFYEDVVRRIAALPGVEEVGTIDSLPLDGGAASGEPYAYDTPTGVLEWGRRSAEYRSVTEGYFRAMGTTLLAGRFFNIHDDLEHPSVVIVDEKLARTAWPDEEAVGQRIQVNRFVGGQDVQEWAEVIGVVESVKNVDLTLEGIEQIYQPHLQSPRRSMKIAMKTAAAASPAATANLVDLIRREVTAVDPERAVFEVRPMTAYVARATARTRLVLKLLSVFAIVSAALAALGIYAVLSYTVRQTTREIGVRLALGADSRRILRQVVGSALGLASIGLVAGLGLAYVLVPTMENLVYGVGVRDGLTFVAVALVALATALVASALPARQASRIDPIRALRSE